MLQLAFSHPWRRMLAGFGALAAVCAPALADVRPKVVVVIEEKVAGIFGTTGWETVGQAESTLASRLVAAGFEVVDAPTVRRLLPRDKALRLLEGDDKAAALAGLQFGAQVVVTGNAISKNAGGKLLGTSMQSLQATVQARAVWSDTGRVIATQTAQSSKAHIDEVQGGVLAIREASEEVADSLTSALLSEAALQRPRGSPATTPAARGRELTLLITGLVSYRHLSFVQQFLAGNVQGVRAVHLRQFAHGTAELGIDYAGQSGLIASDLANQRFSGFRLEPTSVTPNRLDIRAVLER